MCCTKISVSECKEEWDTYRAVLHLSSFETRQMRSGEVELVK